MNHADKCDVCGQPSTNCAMDIRQRYGPVYAWAIWEFIGPKKYGCDIHPVFSDSFDHEGRKIGPNCFEEWQRIKRRAFARIRSDTLRLTTEQSTVGP